MTIFREKYISKSDIHTPYCCHMYKNNIDDPGENVNPHQQKSSQLQSNPETVKTKGEIKPSSYKRPIGYQHILDWYDFERSLLNPLDECSERVCQNNAIWFDSGNTGFCFMHLPIEEVQS